MHAGLSKNLSTGMEWVARNKLNIPHIIHILDDFLIAAESPGKCRAKRQHFLTFCEDVGVPMAPDKTEGPSQVLTFAGIELDCCKNEARLPMEKVEKCLSAIRNLLSRRKVTLKELQSLIGLLNFACSVIVPGRVFLRKLINLTMGVTHSHHFLRLTNETKKDLRIWDTFLDSFNGKFFSWRMAGPHLIAYVFTPMRQNPVVMVPFLVNSGHMVNGQTRGKHKISAFMNFFLLL